MQFQADFPRASAPDREVLANGISIKRGAPDQTPATPAAYTIWITGSLPSPTVIPAAESLGLPN